MISYRVCPYTSTPFHTSHIYISMLVHIYHIYIYICIRHTFGARFTSMVPSFLSRRRSPHARGCRKSRRPDPHSRRATSNCPPAGRRRSTPRRSAARSSKKAWKSWKTGSKSIKKHGDLGLRGTSRPLWHCRVCRRWHHQIPPGHHTTCCNPPVGGPRWTPTKGFCK